MRVSGLKNKTGDGKDDFVIVDPKTGGLTLFKSGGEQQKDDGTISWGWIPVEGQIASGLGGPGKAIRLVSCSPNHLASKGPVFVIQDLLGTCFVT